MVYDLELLSRKQQDLRRFGTQGLFPNEESPIGRGRKEERNRET